MMDDEAVNHALRFRKSLWHGIRSAKKRFGNAPNLLLIDANTELFELPSKGEMQKELDTEQ